MSAVLHHQNLLLDDAEVVPRLQLDNLDGGALTRGQSLGLRKQNLKFLLLINGNDSNFSFH